MDPNLFHLDWERTFEVLATIIVLAFLIERALAIVFEHAQPDANWNVVQALQPRFAGTARPISHRLCNSLGIPT